MTSKKRGSQAEIGNAKEILQEIKNSDSMKMLWEKYRKESQYAREITFEMVTACAEVIRTLCQKEQE